MYLDAAGHPVPAGVGWRLALAAVISLISLIGARIIPTFTRNWLASRRETSLRPAHVGLDRLANAVLHVGLLGWVFLPGNRAFGLLQIGRAHVELQSLMRNSYAVFCLKKKK